MDVRTAIKQRRSIRKFKSKEIPKEIIREILAEARWAPSWGNVQPWEFYVVSGDALQKFKNSNRGKVLNGEPQCPEIPMPEQWPEKFKKRYMGVGKSVLTSLSIARGDIEARNRYYGDMFNLFGAPCLVLACIDKQLSVEYAMLDLGLVMQNICLLAQEKGLGTIILAAAARYPQILRAFLSIPENKTIVIGTAVGYPNWDSPVNHFERQRADLSEFVTWVE